MIRIRGARTHNLQAIDVDLPHHRFIVITGLSGSGKSSLAFDTLYAEGQRRYVESLSAYARQFLSLMEKPDVDQIEGLSPAIAIEQKSTSHNPRSTVGTVTEIYDYLRLLYARVGTPHCPDHGIALNAQTISQMVDHVLTLTDQRIMLLAPLVRARKGEYTKQFDELRSQGFMRVRIDGQLFELDAIPSLDARHKHTIDVVIDRLKVRADVTQRLAESFETALRLGNGLAKVVLIDPADDAKTGRQAYELHAAHEANAAHELLFSATFACPECGYSVGELEPRLFSFNNPQGACPSCDGLGVKTFFDPHRVVQPQRSLADGAIAGWDRRSSAFQTLTVLSQVYAFDLDTVFDELPKPIQHFILHGTPPNDGSGAPCLHLSFRGIIPELERRYRETESAAMRDELARYLSSQPCPTCHGTRLNRAARHVFIAGNSLPAITQMPIREAYQWCNQLNLPGRRGEIAAKILKEITTRLRFLSDVGLDYLTLSRSADTLSGGEAQRIRLASQLGAGLVGVMYVLDEPSIGLHPRDNDRLLKALMNLRDLGNTVIVVEHDSEAMLHADHIVDMGPGAGIHGGRVVAAGTPQDIMNNPASLTGQYLAGHRQIAIPAQRKRMNPNSYLRIVEATGHNLKRLTVEIPLGLITCVTGVSGSGKSTLINDTLYAQAARDLNGAHESPAPCRAIEGLTHLDKVVNIDQSPIGRTPRSNPATYTGLFTSIRELFAATPEARSRGYKVGRFSFNVKGGRCEACQGDGVIKVAMHFLPDIYVSCDHCGGKRYNRETLAVHYKGKTIHEVLELTVEDALDFFNAIPAIAHKLRTLMEVGLSYIRLGQNATTLSGGEAQRLKLARELSRRDTGKTLYILDEPTTGLHFHDIEQLLRVLHQLRDRGNTIIVIEHNLDVIKTADWIIDLGPEGGQAGGELVVAGPPELVAQHPRSHTGRFLAPLLGMTSKVALSVHESLAVE